jgi:hypothetical protein
LKGLLNRAENIRTYKNSPVKSDSIISNEEQQEIMKEIDRISGQSRIQVTPDLFQFSALKKGFLFPLLVNLLAFGILGGGLYATKYYFEIKDRELEISSAEHQSAEGNLIREIKKDTEERLAEKETEILDIQLNLQKIESERLALEKNMDSKISEREAQMQLEMERVLEEERAKLQSRGISSEEIEEQIALLKLEQISLFEEEIDLFREEAELEKIALESNLSQLHKEYNQKLVTISEEKTQIEIEARSREAELTARMENRTRALESEKTAARLEIERLTQISEKENLVENQIIGFYRKIENLIREGELDQASVELNNLENYLYEESVITLAGISKRREIDLFVIDSLSKLVESSKTDPQEELDTISLIDAAERFKEIKDMVRNADQQMAVGNVELADIMYRNALEKIPEINRSHQYFYSALENELEIGYEQLSSIQKNLDSLERANAERNDRVAGLLNKAGSAYNTGNYQQAVDEYKRALVATDIKNMDVAAEQMLNSSNNIATAPLKTEVNGLNSELNALSDSQKQILQDKQSLENELAYRDNELISLNRKLGVSDGELLTLKDQISEQTEQIQSYEQRIEEMKAGLKKEEIVPVAVTEELLDDEIAQLTTLKARLNRLNKSYNDFEVMADSLKENDRGDARTIEALYDFFEEDSVEDVFPGMGEYLRSFSSVYVNAGTEIGLYESVSLLYELNGLTNTGEKLNLLKSKKDSYSDNVAMMELISQLEESYGRGD